MIRNETQKIMATSFVLFKIVFYGLTMQFYINIATQNSTQSIS